MQHLSGSGSLEMQVAERRRVAIESAFDYLEANTSFWIVGGPERQDMLDRFFYYYFPEKDNTIRVEMNAYLKQLEAKREDVIGDEADEHAKRKMRDADDAEQERQRKAKERRKKK